jgi:cell division transport system permease protein
VLFLLGILGLFVINSKKLSDDFKEEIAMTVFFKNDVPDSTLTAFGEKIRTEAFVREANFVTKEQAAKQHKEVIGEDFMQFLGVNPLQNSYDIFLKADYVTNESLAKIDRQLRSSNEGIADVVYDKQLVTLVNDNIEKISSIYSNRFIIKTMQMVGATKSFIRKPFIRRSIKLGIIGAVVAIIALVALLYYVNMKFPDLGILDQPLLVGGVLVGILLLGILITWISTFIATQRFLNLRTDDLY